MKVTITENERLQLLGLLVVAQQHAKGVMSAEKAAAAILEIDDNDLGHYSDAVYESDADIDDILKKMGIKVTDATA